MTKGELAQAIGCSEEELEKIEEGKRLPSMAQDFALAKALGVPLEAFYYDH